MRRPAAVCLTLAASLLLACQDTPSSVDGLPETETPVMQEGGLTSDDLTNVSMTDAEKAAMELFAYQEGEWNSEWAFFDEDGKIVRTLTGGVTFSFLVDKYSQMLTNVIPATRHTSYALRSFSAAEQHIIFLNVGPEGEYWVMRKDPVTSLMVSAPHKNIDGTTVVRRFSDIVKNPNSMQVLMESSLDGGKTWAKVYVQTLTRKKYED